MTPQGPTWEHLHLVAVPFTVVLVVAGSLVGVAGWVSGRESLERWGVLSLVIAGAMAIPSYVTGLTAADVAAARTFVEPSLIQTHRSWATWTTVLLVAQGIFGAFSLAQPRDPRLRRFVLALSLGAAVLTSWAAFLGGKIVHSPRGDSERIEDTVTATDRGSLRTGVRRVPARHLTPPPGPRAPGGAKPGPAPETG